MISLQVTKKYKLHFMKKGPEICFFFFAFPPRSGLPTIVGHACILFLYVYMYIIFKLFFFASLFLM